MAEPVDFSSWSCPLPLRSHDRIVMGHGGGGQLSAELVEHLFLPAFGAEPDAELLDAATVALDGSPGRLAFSTDSYVVRPLFFAGGNIGDGKIFVLPVDDAVRIGETTRGPEAL